MYIALRIKSRTQFTNERHLDNTARIVKSWKNSRVANCGGHACFRLITGRVTRSNFRYDEQLTGGVGGNFL